MKELGLYIHIPFCESKCYYCDFISYPNKRDFIEKYVDYLIKEIKMQSEKLKNYKLKTIFIGGGTPSSIDAKYIYNILEEVYKEFNTTFLEEITIEVNPNTIDEDKLKLYKKSNINRISLGLQSSDNNILKRIGRTHTKEVFLKNYKLISKYGFNNVNVDIMFNLPKQTLDDVKKTIDFVTKLDVKHISFYSLKLEKGTPFFDKYKDDKFSLPSEDLEREMYHEGIELLKNRNFHQYEISNFHKKNYKCKHNLLYWKVKPYLGVGLGAHSNLFSERWGNEINFTNYFKAIDDNRLPIFESEKIDKNMEISEYVILGLRLNKGIDKRIFYNRFNVNIEKIYKSQIKKFESEGLLNNFNKRIKLTERGRDISNRVFMELLT
ncbi:MAG: oxygen-independent coproporphyrinogen III oxidase [Firmicutes bacterium]|nr:oxygen-independent coproporphyrinogen III oxidase [Bacillota bacterium]